MARVLKAKPSMGDTKWFLIMPPPTAIYGSNLKAVSPLSLKLLIGGGSHLLGMREEDSLNYMRSRETAISTINIIALSKTTLVLKGNFSKMNLFIATHIDQHNTKNQLKPSHKLL